MRAINPGGSDEPAAHASSITICEIRYTRGRLAICGHGILQIEDHRACAVLSNPGKTAVIVCGGEQQGTPVDQRTNPANLLASKETIHF